MTAPDTTRPVHLPGGVADPAGGVGYLRTDAGVDAVDLATGKARWQSREAFMPILTMEEVVAAAGSDGESVRLLLLAADTGEVRMRSDPLSPVAPVWGVTDARREGGRIRLAWDGWELPRGTPPDPSSPWNGPLAAGSARVDLATGKVEPIRVPLGGAAPEPLPGEDADDLLPDVGGTMRWEVDGSVAAVALEGGRLVLRRWSRESGERLPDVVLADPAPPREALAHFRFPDRGSVFLRTATTGASSRWLVFSAETGAPVAELELTGAEEGMAVVGGRLFHVAPGSTATGPGHRARALRAVDPATGGVLWEHPLASTAITPSPLARAGS